MTDPNHQQLFIGVSYKGLEDAKKINLADPNEDAKLVYTAMDLEPREEQSLIEILQESRNVFAWLYKDLKGVNLIVFSAHHTSLRQRKTKQTTSIFIQ